MVVRPPSWWPRTSLVPWLSSLTAEFASKGGRVPHHGRKGSYHGDIAPFMVAKALSRWLSPSLLWLDSLPWRQSSPTTVKGAIIMVPLWCQSPIMVADLYPYYPTHILLYHTNTHTWWHSPHQGGTQPHHGGTAPNTGSDRNKTQAHTPQWPQTQHTPAITLFLITLKDEPTTLLQMAKNRRIQ